MIKNKRKIQKKNLHSFFINKIIIKNKKSQLFMIVLVLITLICFTSLYAIMLTKKDGFDRDIGERQISIFKANSDTQKVLFYIDQSAVIASKNVSMNLAEKGGFEKSICGDYFGFNLWNENIKECMPTKPKDEFKTKFKIEFENILKKYPGEKIPASYEYFFNPENDKKFYGKSNDPIIVEIKNG
ncbi:hypothetical protein HN415_01010 [Candidatus Woesearchaeota archaeon]|jgi:hypothetical protein|nr:hypothetical protein [Candidatus Woesearchaeota archaeon]